ncbi:type VI secretion system contractile sheath small subunit [Aliivibrio fischeri]|uniref:type VI secretion system contractile sheath small subunit n=1 Tax=Aliivibrio fischeri TaxID=668 RepID=UPI000907FEF1|nr:type VI secretion system contractile sheath small subunit [Aliivibrio fischeri]
MSKDGSVAPKERVNVTFKPVSGDAAEDLELPLKMMVLGDFTQQEDDRKLEDRKPFNVDKSNFNDVIEKQNLNISFGVKNQLQDDREGNEEIAVDLSFKHINDFDPSSIVEQVPELKGLMDLREALVSLKGPLGNVPAFRKAIEDALVDDEAREKLLSELGLVTEKE